MEDPTLAARDAVVAHLEALYTFVAGIENSAEVLCLLQNTILRWRSVSDAQAIGAARAAESCEVVVAVLRLLRGDLGLTPSQAVQTYTCAFLVLACTVHVFEESRDIPAPGQAVMLNGLQSSAAQRLNGAWGVVIRFHAESGRFIVRLEPHDPPADWKKVRAENLCIPQDASPKTKAVSIAREHGRSCLEAVSDIFDDLLQDMLLEASDLEDASFAKLMTAELATAMWEVLVCCAGDGALRLSGASFLELCGSTALCALVARYVLSTHVGFRSGFLGLGSTPFDHDPRRLRTLQESLARSYCELFQPAALWKITDEVGNAPMTELQADLEAHVRSVAEASVNFGVLPAFVDAVDFHLAGVAAAQKPGPLPLVLPVLLSRLVCTLLTPAVAATGVVQRHVQMHMINLLEVMHVFAVLASARLTSDGPGATPSVPELLAALRAVLEALVAITNIGLWHLGPEVVQLVEATVGPILDAASGASDPAVLARLVLIFMRQPPGAAGVAARLATAYSLLPEVYQALFWRQLRARGALCNLPAAEVQRLAQDWLFASGVEVHGVEAGEVTSSDDLAIREVAHQHHEIDSLIEKCLREMPQSLRELPTPRLRTKDMSAGTGQVEAPLLSEPYAPSPDVPVVVGQDGQSRLSMLNMPALPNQLPRANLGMNGVQANGLQKQRTKKLVRADFGKIRGVDPAAAPQELRCAIDGKILGNPLRSPYGHLFERETLESWINMCGSVCPVTGQPLRLEDCAQDQAIEQKVLEWAKAAKAEHKRRVQENRERRVQSRAPDLSTDILL